MNLLLKRLKTEWPGWMVVAFFAFLPFGRLAELPLAVFAFALPVLWSRPHHRARIRAAVFTVAGVALDLVSAGLLGG
jgi:hypothetical protein